jgi:N-acetylglucosamine-6-sulfatase
MFLLAVVEFPLHAAVTLRAFNPVMKLPIRFVFAIATCFTSLMAAERPNILFIFSDDHALQAISAYSDRFAKISPTPNIDRIAKDGMLFERSYCGNSICGPSRATVLTGKHTHLNGYMDNTYCRFDGAQPTFPKMLQHAGYETAVIGKWHLISNPTGFDHWEVLPAQGSYYNPDFLEMDGSRQRSPGYVTDIITDKSLDWLKNRKDKSKPFILMCQHKAPHRDWVPAERHMDLFDDIAIPEPATLFDGYQNRIAAVAKQQMQISKNFTWGHDMFLPGKPTDPRFAVSRFDSAAEVGRMTPSQVKSFDAAYGEENQKLLDQLAKGMSALEIPTLHEELPPHHSRGG